MNAHDVTCDVLVAGSGAAGFATALTAHLEGLDVIMVEKAPLFGGTPAYSAGVVWIPINSAQRAAGVTDSAPSRARLRGTPYGGFPDDLTRRLYAHRSAGKNHATCSRAAMPAMACASPNPSAAGSMMPCTSRRHGRLVSLVRFRISTSAVSPATSASIGVAAACQ